MKYFIHVLTIGFFFAFSIVNAQNLMLNAGLESWTGGLPDNWTAIENITQETGTIHGGVSSAKHTSASTTKDFRQEIGGLQEGQEYTISYWYYDNDPNARTRIWSYWTVAGTNLPDNADELRPSVYSTDIPSWQQYSVVLNAPPTADGFKFEVRVYNQDGNSGGSVFYDDFEFSGDVTVVPEPSNYPTNFMAVSPGLSVDLSWTDAIGAQLPTAYIIMAGTSASLPVPVDGTPIANDTDLSDGSGALNVNYGQEAATFLNLEGNTSYYFAIYSYTNVGANIDFKTDGSAPSANATTSNFVVIESENFDLSWGNWTVVSLLGVNEWDRDNTFGVGGTPCASATGYIGGTPPAYEDSDDWLISPAMNFNNYDNESIVFFNTWNYTGPDMEFKISTNYDGGGDPNTATWTSLPFTLSPGNWQWTSSGEIDLSTYNSDAVYVAFHFTSTTASSATWEVDDILITGEEDMVVKPEPSNYPTNFDAEAGTTSITISWNDAIGIQLPDAYIIYASTNPSLPVPVDGTPVPNDPDLSDGSGAMNVSDGIEDYTFAGIGAATTIYFSIYPYTNSGSNIDYKNDGTAPTANATTILIPEPTNYPTAFEANASGTSINVLWVDAVGNQLPENYILYAGNASSLPMPVDGTPVIDDPDLSDGSAQINVAFGTEQASFAGLTPGTTYYFSIYPYTNSGSNIDYKNDGTAPTANATIILIPEPTNYPTAFEANASGTSIDVLWVDAVGSQLPENYILYAGITSSLPIPVDGTPVIDDPDLSDGSAQINVAFGTEQASFAGLSAGTTYYFTIYPYTNTGANINYKTDGTVPTANAETSSAVPVVIESEGFDVSWGNWTVISLLGDNEWDRDNTYGVGGTPCASVTGHIGGTPPEFEDSDDWLVSPAMNFDIYKNEKIEFFNAWNYSGPDMEFKVSTDYDGGGDPSSATWESLPFTMSPGSFTWTSSGEVDLSGYNGIVYVAFHFTCTTEASATWEVDDIVISGELITRTHDLFANPKVSVYPNPAGEVVNINQASNFFTKVEIKGLNGRTIKTIGLAGMSSKLDVGDLPSGLYFLLLINEENGRTHSEKLIIR